MIMNNKIIIIDNSKGGLESTVFTQQEGGYKTTTWVKFTTDLNKVKKLPKLKIIGSKIDGNVTIVNDKDIENWYADTLTEWCSRQIATTWYYQLNTMEIKNLIDTAKERGIESDEEIGWIFSPEHINKFIDLILNYKVIYHHGGGIGFWFGAINIINFNVVTDGHKIHPVHLFEKFNKYIKEKVREIKYR